MRKKFETKNACGMASAALALVAVPSFVLFSVLSLSVGGDALNGFVLEGRYYVTSHGTDTEVSRITYNVSWYLGAITLATFVPMVLFAAASEFLDKRAKVEK
jgi:hypothetical protein